jgi:hypothetical protein
VQVAHEVCESIELAHAQRAKCIKATYGIGACTG